MAASNTRAQRMIQNFHLVWLDANIDEKNNEDCRNSITQLRQVVNTVNTFVDAEKCIHFINGIQDAKAFIISSGAFGETTVSVIHNKSQVNTIYIFCQNKARHEKWTKAWPKIQGVFTDIKPICKALQQAVKDCDHNTVSISFVKKTSETSKQNLDSLDKSFMYTQILKEILLTINFEGIHINEFLSYCRELFNDNNIELGHVNKIEKEYWQHEPIWWYTYQSFLYSMLNRALRTMEVDLIIKMGFFLKDVHNHIVKLHSQQFNGHYNSDSFTVYRGQGLSQTDFHELQQTQGGLLSFNNFLSTSTNPEVSLDFARRTINTSDLMGVLFVMQINPSISTTPFANVKDVSYFKGEDEILFSMHSVFRIGKIKQLDGNTRLWQVDLTLTSDNDPQLHALTEYIRKETFPHQKGWQRLGNILIELGQFDKAEQVCNILLDQTTDEREMAIIYHMLGMINNDQGKYEDAVHYYEQSIEIKQKLLSPTHIDLGGSYNNLGSVYDNMGEYSKALIYYEKALEIAEKTLHENDPHLATSYNNIGAVYYQMGEYSKALSYYEKDLKISKKTLPENHPSLATSYNNIGLVYKNMGECSKALSYYEEALRVLKITLPENHPSLATAYSNIGNVYNKMGECSKALFYYEKALEIDQKTLPENHPDLGTSYNNIAWVYRNMSDYRKALQYYERALDIRQRTLPSNHPHIRSVKESIEIVGKKL